MTRRRGAAARRNPRNLSIASMIGASRPKKIPASASSSGIKPR